MALSDAFSQPPELSPRPGNDDPSAARSQAPRCGLPCGTGRGNMQIGAIWTDAAADWVHRSSPYTGDSV